MTTVLQFRYILRLLSALLLLAATPAYAHSGAGTGWVHGMFHPFTGIDHLLAMIAVGLWATQLGGRALWQVPLTFVCVMALGGVLGTAAIPLPFVQSGIFASSLVLGVLIAAAIRLPTLVSLVMVGLFALFHGYAHGAEMPRSASGLTYALGFMLSTAALHASGILIASGFGKIGRPQWLSVTGGLIALSGGALFLLG